MLTKVIETIHTVKNIYIKSKDREIMLLEVRIGTTLKGWMNRGGKGGGGCQ